jgi:hypothetical protein
MLSPGRTRLLVAPCAAERGVVAAGRQRIEERLRLERAAARLGPDEEWLRAIGDRLGVGVDDQPRADLRGVPIAELDHLAELVGGVDVKKREWNGTRVERFLRQAQQDRRVLADRIQHHRPLELGHHLAHDVDRFGLERAQMGIVRGHYPVNHAGLREHRYSHKSSLSVSVRRSSFVVRCQKQKARVAPGFRSRVCVGCRLLDIRQRTWTCRAGTIGVLMQQQAQVAAPNIRTLY